MRFLALFSPLRAFRDLRSFLSRRKPHELGFLMLSMVLTSLTLFAFTRDSHFKKAYKRDIIYFQSWPASRTDEEVRAQQAIDAPIEARRRAAFEKRKADRQAAFKRHDDQLSKWGL